MSKAQLIDCMMLTRRLIEKSSESRDTIYRLTSVDRTSVLAAIGQGDTTRLAAFSNRAAAAFPLWQELTARIVELSEDERLILSEFCDLEKSYCALLETYALTDAEQAEIRPGTR